MAVGTVWFELRSGFNNIESKLEDIVWFCYLMFIYAYLCIKLSVM